MPATPSLAPDPQAQDVRHESGLYPYTVPKGFGDTPFVYVFDAQDESLTNAQSYFQRGITIGQGDFILRYISGWHTMLGVTSGSGFNAYDFLERRLFAKIANLGSFAEGMVVLPEWPYPVNGRIEFDIQNVLQASAGVIGGLTVYRSQLAFFGAKRRKNVENAPGPSAYTYYEKVYDIPYTLTITNLAASGGQLLPAVRQIIPVNDFDFELRRIELQLTEEGQASQFKILLYDQNEEAISNKAVLSNLFCHVNPDVSSGELSFAPNPPLLYRVNSAIEFDITSLLAVAPATFHLLFRGVRRIPCS